MGDRGHLRGKGATCYFVICIPWNITLQLLQFEGITQRMMKRQPHWTRPHAMVEKDDDGLDCTRQEVNEKENTFAHAG